MTRGVLAALDPGPFDVPPPRRLPAEAVEVLESPRGVMVRVEGQACLGAVGALLYEMLAGGPLHVAKDRAGAPPRPLGKLRAFLGGGPLPAGLEPYVNDLLEERFPSAEAALDALLKLEIE